MSSAAADAMLADDNPHSDRPLPHRKGGALPPPKARPSDLAMAARLPAPNPIAHVDDGSEDARLLNGSWQRRSVKDRNGLSRNIPDGSNRRRDRLAGCARPQLCG